jgi:hypothetical protein
MPYPFVVPWSIVLPSFLGAMCVVAAIAWVIGRAALRSSIDRQAHRHRLVAVLDHKCQHLEKQNNRLEQENQELRQTIKAITSLSANVLGSAERLKIV